jgi:hypothetical protein
LATSVGQGAAEAVEPAMRTAAAVAMATGTESAGAAKTPQLVVAATAAAEVVVAEAATQMALVQAAEVIAVHHSRSMVR